LQEHLKIQREKYFGSGENSVKLNEDYLNTRIKAIHFMVESNEDETLPMIKEVYDFCLLLNHTENWIGEFFGGNKEEKFLKYLLDEFFYELTQKTLLNSKFKYNETLVYSSKILE
jgi:hypothetical protein